MRDKIVAGAVACLRALTRQSDAAVVKLAKALGIDCTAMAECEDGSTREVRSEEAWQEVSLPVAYDANQGG